MNKRGKCINEQINWNKQSPKYPKYPNVVRVFDKDPIYGSDVDNGTAGPLMMEYARPGVRIQTLDRETWIILIFKIYELRA